MQFLLTSFLAVASLTSATWVTRKGTRLELHGKTWTAGGANVYWLGLDENVTPPPGEPYYAPKKASYPTKGRIVEVMRTLQTLGATTVRSQTLGISVGNPLSLMPKLGEWNEKAFETIDWAIYQAGKHGIKVQVPLVDNYDYYHGGKFDFCRFRGINVSGDAGYGKVDPRIQQFYTNPVIVDDFKTYVKKLITHRNQFTGLTMGQDPTVYAFETGNELSGPIFRDMNIPIEWTTDIAQFVKKLAPRALIMDGTYGINKSHLAIKEVDIFSDHFYPTNLTQLQSGIDLVAEAGKTYIAGEYDWTGNIKSAAPLKTFLGVLESRQKLKDPVAIGSQFWSLFMHNVPNCTEFVPHDDGFTLQYGNPANTKQTNTQISIIRQHLWAMRGKEVSENLPPVRCPKHY